MITFFGNVETFDTMRKVLLLEVNRKKVIVNTCPILFFLIKGVLTWLCADLDTYFSFTGASAVCSGLALNL